MSFYDQRAILYYDMVENKNKLLGQKLEAS